MQNENAFLNIYNLKACEPGFILQNIGILFSYHYLLATSSRQVAAGPLC